MFKSISWLGYLQLIGFVALAYYAVLLAVFYSRDILSKLKGLSGPLGKSSAANQPVPTGKLMGAIADAPRRKIPIKQSLAIANELSLQVNPEDLLRAQRVDSPAAELYERLESLFKIMKVEKVKKPNLKNIKTLFTQYPDFKDTPIRQEINGFVYEHFRKNTGANFSEEEIDFLWGNEK